MILDSIDNRKKYTGIHPGIDRLLEVMKDYTSDHYPEGKLSLDGENLFLMFGNYETHSHEVAQMEAHKQYIDVMYMVEGSEVIYVKPVDEMLHVTMPYDEAIDALIGDLDSDAAEVLMKPGMFVILFPQDAHAPACCADGLQKVKKLIGKVRI